VVLEDERYRCEIVDTGLRRIEEIVLSIDKEESHWC
jgi:hypothetical protein